MPSLPNFHNVSGDSKETTQTRNKYSYKVNQVYGCFLAIGELFVLGAVKKGSIYVDFII